MCIRDSAHIDRKEMQYLYNDGDLYYFMDTETYDQIAVNNDTVGDSLKFVKENENVKLSSYQGSVFAIEPPLNVELEITETEPGFKGDTATGATKPAIVETGAQVMVPLFVESGEKIKIDTRTAVSYTHLDVYKRQDAGGPCGISDGQPFRRPGVPGECKD